MEPWMLDPTEFTPLNVSMFGRRYVKRWQASVKQYRTYDYWRQLFWTAAISRFEWEGLPDGIDSRYLETLLCGYGSFAATKRSTSGVLAYWCGRMNPVGNLDLYRNPNTIDVYTPNGQRQRRHCRFCSLSTARPSAWPIWTQPLTSTFALCACRTSSAWTNTAKSRPRTCITVSIPGNLPSI